MKNTFPGIVLLTGCLFILQGCVATYKRMPFDYTPLETKWNAIDEPQLHMAIDYDVLTGPGMKSYAAMERKNKVNLVIVTIHNTGTSDFVIARDAVFQNHDGASIVPLSLEAAMTSLVKPITDKPKNSSVEVEGASGIKFLWGAGKAANTAKKLISHVRFANDMLEHYIAETKLAPGSITRGILVLPVVRGSLVTSTLRTHMD